MLSSLGLRDPSYKSAGRELKLLTVCNITGNFLGLIRVCKALEKADRP